MLLKQLISAKERLMYFGMQLQKMENKYFRYNKELQKMPKKDAKIQLQKMKNKYFRYNKQNKTLLSGQYCDL